MVEVCWHTDVAWAPPWAGPWAGMWTCQVWAAVPANMELGGLIHSFDR